MVCIAFHRGPASARHSFTNICPGMEIDAQRRAASEVRLRKNGHFIKIIVTHPDKTRNLSTNLTLFFVWTIQAANRCTELIKHGILGAIQHFFVTPAARNRRGWTREPGGNPGRYRRCMRRSRVRRRKPVTGPLGLGRQGTAVKGHFQTRESEDLQGRRTGLPANGPQALLAWENGRGNHFGCHGFAVLSQKKGEAK